MFGHWNHRCETAGCGLPAVTTVPRRIGNLITRQVRICATCLERQAVVARLRAVA